VLDHVGETLKRAHGHLVCFFIFGLTVTQSLTRKHHLGVSHDTESTRFKKRLLKPNTPAVDINSSLLIIDGVDDKVSFLPKLVVKDVLSIRSYEFSHCLHLDVWVHLLGSCTSCFRFRVTHVFMAEQELAVQVRDLDLIIVGNNYLSVGTTAESH